MTIFACFAVLLVPVPWVFFVFGECVPLFWGFGVQRIWIWGFEGWRMGDGWEGNWWEDEVELEVVVKLS